VWFLLRRSHLILYVCDGCCIRAVYADPTKTVFMCDVKQFLHKVTPEVMESTGAIIPGTKQVGVAYCIVEFMWARFKGKCTSSTLTSIKYTFGQTMLYRSQRVLYCTNTALFAGSKSQMLIA